MAGFGDLIPLIILLVVLGIFVFIGYHLRTWSNELAEKAGKQMEQKHMSFTRDGGLRVGVKEMRDESVGDKTQNVLVNVWNKASLPNYKSRLGWNSTQAAEPAKKSRPILSRHASSNPSRSISSSNRSSQAPPESTAQATGSSKHLAA